MTDANSKPEGTRKSAEGERAAHVERIRQGSRGYAVLCVGRWREGEFAHRFPPSSHIAPPGLRLLAGASMASQGITARASVSMLSAIARASLSQRRRRVGDPYRSRDVEVDLGSGQITFPLRFETATGVKADVYDLLSTVGAIASAVLGGGWL